VLVAIALEHVDRMRQRICHPAGVDRPRDEVAERTIADVLDGELSLPFERCVQFIIRAPRLFRPPQAASEIRAGATNATLRIMRAA
jgi:hypothetical protein